jgi:hypothetical protein
MALADATWNGGAATLHQGGIGLLGFGQHNAPKRGWVNEEDAL